MMQGMQGGPLGMQGGPQGMQGGPQQGMQGGPQQGMQGGPLGMVPMSMGGFRPNQAAQMQGFALPFGGSEMLGSRSSGQSPEQFSPSGGLSPQQQQHMLHMQQMHHAQQLQQRQQQQQQQSGESTQQLLSPKSLQLRGIVNDATMKQQQQIMQQQQQQQQRAMADQMGANVYGQSTRVIDPYAMQPMTPRAGGGGAEQYLQQQGEPFSQQQQQQQLMQPMTPRPTNDSFSQQQHQPVRCLRSSSLNYLTKPLYKLKASLAAFSFASPSVWNYYLSEFVKSSEYF